MDQSNSYPIYEAQVRVRYQETDQMRVVYHSNYLHYFEVGRTSLLRECGCIYRDLEEEGYLLAVTDCQAKFILSALYDDLLTIRTRVTRRRRASLELAYKVMRGEELLAIGSTSHVVLDRDTKKIVRPPEMLVNALDIATLAT